MKYFQLGSLDKFLEHTAKQDLSWAIRFRMATQLAQGLAYLHSHQVVHGDIKSMNVLVDEALNVKWADFGFIKTKNMIKTLVGQTDIRNRPPESILWMAPEQVEGKVQCSTQADVYSLGVVMWKLASHQLPDPGIATLFALIKQIGLGKTSPIPVDTPSRFRDAIQHCWFSNPQSRPNARNLASYLADEHGTTLIT